jgi:hypothetical protein
VKKEKAVNCGGLEGSGEKYFGYCGIPSRITCFDISAQPVRLSRTQYASQIGARSSIDQAADEPALMREEHQWKI